MKPKTKIADLPAGHKFTPSNDDASPIEALCLDVARATVRRKPATGQPLTKAVGEDLAEMLARELAHRLADVAPAAMAETIGGDLLEGADAIAVFLFGDGADKRKVYSLVQVGAMPVFRLSGPTGIVCARKSTLLAWIKRQEEE